MTSVNDLVSGVINRIDGLPTATITGSPVIWSYVNDARLFVQNITRLTISASSIDETFSQIITDLGAAYVVSRMTGVGVTFDYSLGNFKVNRGQRTLANTSQLDHFVSMANMSLKYLGTKIPFRATFL